MDKKTVFVKTEIGASEVQGHSSELYGDVKRILLLVDNKSSVGEITKRAPPSLREALPEVLQILLEDGYIKDNNAPPAVAQKSSLKISAPAFKMSTPKEVVSGSLVAAKSQPVKSNSNASKSDLDFSLIHSGDAQNKNDVDKAKEKALAEAKVFAEAKAKAQAEARAQAENDAKVKQEADRIKALQAAQIEAASRAAKLKAYEEAKERARHEVAAKAKIEAEDRIKNEVEAARRKAEQEILNARSELEATKARVEQEVRSRIEAELRVKQEVEAANLKAQQQAEKLRLELQAAKAKAEAELKIRLEAEARAKAEAEARIKREEEAERLRIEKERVEKEAARAKAEAEIKMRTEAELRVRAEVEARLKAEEEERLKREMEAERLKLERELAEIELARVKAEAELKMRKEAELRIRAEVEARLRSDELAKNGDRRKAPSDTANGSRGAEASSPEEQHVQEEMLKRSFVESFNQSKSKQQKSSLFNFKLDTFSLSGKWKKADPSLVPKGLEDANAGDGSEQEAEAKRIKDEQEAARIKAAEQEAARVKAENEAAERTKAEQEAARRTAEQEAYRAQAEQNERQAKAEAEARELAGQQARQWEEAQRRASVQAERERMDREAASVQAKSGQKASRTPRKPIPVGKISLGIFVLVLIVVMAIPYVGQYDEYIAPIEKEISTQLNQPVRIKKIRVTLLPMPKLELIGLNVGSKQEFQAGEATLYFNLSALLSSTKPVNKIVLNKISLNGSSFIQVLGWLQSAGGNEKYPVASIELKGVNLTSDDIKIPVFNALTDFDSQGKFVKAELKSEDGKIGLEMQLLQQRLQLELKTHESSLPVFPNLRFKDLSVTGVIENGEFIINDIFAHIYGGTLTGKGQLNWTNGWKLQGQLLSKSLELQSLFPNFGVTGELFGDVNFTMHGLNLGQLNKDVRLDGSFDAKNGVINKLDIDSIARFGARQGVARSRTNYTQLAGNFKADNRGQRVYLNKMLIGVVSGSGLFEVDATQQLSGKLSVNINGTAGKRVPLQLSGSLTEPQLQPGR